MGTDRREKLLEKKKQLEEQLRALDSRQKQQQRKLDTRRKIIAGALALEHAEGDEDFAATLYRLINRYVRKPQERALFGLDPLAEDHAKDGQDNQPASGPFRTSAGE